MNEAEYLMKNYGDRGGRYLSRPTASTDNTLRDLHNSSYDTKAEDLLFHITNLFCVEMGNLPFFMRKKANLK